VGVQKSEANVGELKRIDDALMAFGQFLGKYNSDAEHPVAPERQQPPSATVAAR
jgi:hypothetical protein